MGRGKKMKRKWRGKRNGERGKMKGKWERKG